MRYWFPTLNILSTTSPSTLTTKGNSDNILWSGYSIGRQAVNDTLLQVIVLVGLAVSSLFIFPRATYPLILTATSLIFTRLVVLAAKHFKAQGIDDIQFQMKQMHRKCPRIEVYASVAAIGMSNLLPTISSFAALGVGIYLGLLIKAPKSINGSNRTDPKKRETTEGL